MSLSDELAAIIRPIVQAAVRDAMTEQGRGEAAEYMSPERAAALCDVTPATVRAWIKAGDLRGYRAGRLLRVSRAELERYLQRTSASQEDDAEVEDLARRMIDRRRAR